MAPQTGYELTGEWTTLADEAAFLSQVAAETEATVTVAGQSVEGRDIPRVDLGAGIGNTALIVCLQHGNEPASREAALMQIRDLAYSTDPGIVDYLATHRIVWMPSTGPDSFFFRRNNANNVNPNRDFFKLTQPEVQAITSVIRDAQPHLIVDAHEYFSTGQDWWYYAGGLPSTHPEIATLEQNLVDSGISVLQAQGYTTRIYSPGSMPRAGLSTAAGSHHAVGLLSETNAREGSIPDRVAIQKIILDMVRDWHAANAAACTAARQKSLTWALTSPGPDQLMIRDEYIGGKTPEEVYLSGYQLADGETLPEKYVDHFGIQVEPGGFVPIQQEARHIIPQLLDPAAMDKQVTATRVAYVAPEPPTPSEPLPSTPLIGMKVRIGGQTRDVIGIHHQVNGTAREILVPGRTAPGEGGIGQPGDGPGAPTPTGPLTSFEINGEWTSNTREEQFLTQIATDTSATLSEAGRTVGDKPIWRLDIGTGTDNTLLFVGQQHANEPSGREAVLAMVRDLAYSTDPGIVDYLATHRVVIVPNVNPDGAFGSRLNPNGINLNRDHFQLTQPEVRAVAAVIRDTNPTVIYDLHENGLSVLPDWAGSPESIAGTHTGLTQLGESLYDRVVDGVIAGGQTAGRYPRSYIPVAGLTGIAGVNHAVGLIHEPLNQYGRATRVKVSRLAVDSAREWHEDNSTALLEAKSASIEHALTTTDPVPLITTEMVTGEPISLNVAGYELTGPLPDHLVSLHGIEVDGTFVSVNQPARLAVAMLCDPESREKSVQATRVMRSGS